MLPRWRRRRRQVRAMSGPTVFIRYGVPASGKTFAAVRSGALPVIYRGGIWHLEHPEFEDILTGAYFGDERSLHVLVDDYDGQSIPGLQLLHLFEGQAVHARLPDLGDIMVSPDCVTVTSRFHPHDWVVDPLLWNRITRVVHGLYNHPDPYVGSSPDPHPFFNVPIPPAGPLVWTVTQHGIDIPAPADPEFVVDYNSDSAASTAYADDEDSDPFDDIQSD